MAKIAAVVFDVYKTLLDNQTDEEGVETYDFLSRWVSYHGLGTDPVSLKRRYQELCKAEMETLPGSHPDFDIGKVFYRILSDSRNRDFDVGAKARDMALLFRILTTKSIAVYPGVVEMLSALKGKVKLGIVSNAQRLFTLPELAKFDLDHFFSTIALSSEIGSRKPEPKLFRTALEALGVTPETAVYVGDNISDDIDAAGAIGMKTVWLNHDSRPPEKDQKDWRKPDYEVKGKAYDELTKLLLSLV